jgi:hypothetical protein
MGVLLIIFQLLPSIMAAITSVEAAIPGSGSGETKKQIVMAVIEAVLHAGEKIPNSTVQAVSNLIDKLVSTFNASGILGFVKKL